MCIGRELIAAFVALIFALGSGAATARADAQGGGGGMDTGGGDAYSQEFVRTGWSILRQLLIQYPANAPRIDLTLLQRSLQDVRVESTDEPLLLEGVAKDALNFPNQSLIRIHRGRWRELNRSQKRELVLHEYLRFMGVDDSRYQVSAPIAEALSSELRFKNGHYGAQSEQDQVLLSLRGEFEVAMTPEIPQLRLGRQWVCSEYFAEPAGRPNLKLQRKYVFAGEAPLIRNEGSDDVRVFSHDGLEFSGRDERGNVSFIRVNSQGDLLVEKTTPATFFGPMVSSGTFAGKVSQVVSYAQCLRTQIDTLPLLDRRYCGFFGSIDERIVDCGQAWTSEGKKRWSLVSRLKDGLEIWRDDSTALLWTGVLSAGMLNREDGFALCLGKNGFPPTDWPINFDWEVPFFTQFIEAEGNGFLEGLKGNRGNLFWIRSSEGDWVWASVEFPEVGPGRYRFERWIHFLDRAQVRCVGRAR